MRFINDDKVKLFFILILVFTIKNFLQTSISNKLSLLDDAKQFESTAPVLLKSRWIYYQYISVFAICLNESFSNHCCNHCLAKTDDVRKEQPIMLQ